MTMLALIQRFCKRTQIPVPNTVFGTSDDQIQQVLALLEEEGTDLSGRGDWNELTFEATHTTLALEDQGKIADIASNNFRYFKQGTFWDRSLLLPVFVIDGKDWAAIKAFAVTGPRYHARIRGGDLLSNPVPTAGNTWAFEYVSWNWILDTDGTTGKQYFTADTDTLLLPDPILLQGLRWRWKKEKGFDYEEDFNTYENLVKDALGRDGLNRVFYMNETDRPQEPGVIIPQGNWQL